MREACNEMYVFGQSVFCGAGEPEAEWGWRCVLK